MHDKIKQILDLVEELNKATVEYDKGYPIMSDEEWDNKYFTLVALENENKFFPTNSPTQKIYFETVSALNKVTHNHKMLSLAKTKDENEVITFLNNQAWIAMAKMDGLTCSLHYINGRLVAAETRGNGLIGEDILHNAKVIPSIPKYIDYKDELIIDGEIICTYNDFKAFEKDYANPRNFASGSIRLLSSQECYQRNLSFVAWDIIQGFSEINFLHLKLEKLKELGFIIVPYNINTTVSDSINTIKEQTKLLSYPIDGIVFKFNDINYGQACGCTAHHFKNAIAFKFYDETYSSYLKNIEWTMGRTGVLTPVAVFNPIEVEDSIIERASLHNITIMQTLLGKTPWIGQKVEVAKMNMIIPQIMSAETETIDKDVEFLLIPEVCPICGEPLKVEQTESCENLFCSNKNCSGKLINQLDHFCGKKGMDIKGLSLATLTKLIDLGWVSNRADIYQLERFKTQWVALEGFGEKSVTNILSAIENSKQCTLDAFITALGIPLIGPTVAKDLVKVITSYEDLRTKIDNHYNFSKISGFADNKTNALLNYDYTDADTVYTYLTIGNNITDNQSQVLLNQTIVITGSLKLYKNRAELQSVIEAAGGKVASSISKNTTCLINNDITSQSAKNISAKKLNIPIVTETEFLQNYLKK